MLYAGSRGRMGSMTITEVRPETQTSHGSGDDEPDGFAHYVDKSKIADAVVFGNVVQALCGRRWVPSRDPKKFPVCPNCKRIYDNILHGEDDAA